MNVQICIYKCIVDVIYRCTFLDICHVVVVTNMEIDLRGKRVRGIKIMLE